MAEIFGEIGAVLSSQGCSSEASRTALASASHTSLKTLFASLKAISSTLDPPRREVRKEACSICKRTNHVTANCYQRDKGSNGTESTSNRRSNRDPDKSRTELTSYASRSYNASKGGNPPRSTSGLICYHCHQKGHISRDCPAKSSGGSKTTESSGCVMRIETLRCPVNPNKYEKEFRSGGNVVKALIDTGCSLNLVSERILHLLEITDSSYETTTLRGFGSSTVTCERSIWFGAEIDEHEYLIPAVVTIVGTNVDIILGQAFLESTVWSEVEGRIIFGPLNTLVSQEVNRLMRIEVESQHEPLFGPETTPGIRNIIRNEINSLNGNSQVAAVECPIKLRIELTSDKIVRRKHRPLAFAEEIIVDSIVEEWLQKGFIRPSTSEYSSPVVLVPKKDGEHRLCINFKALNKITKSLIRQMPNIEHLVADAGRKKIYSKVDLKNAFFHVPMAEESVKYTAFVTARGQYEFVVVPFGLKNSPLVFSEFIEFIIADFIKTGSVKGFQDDYFIATDTIVEHVEVLVSLFERMRVNGLKLNIAKCEFLFREIEYLGFRIAHGTIQPGSEKTEAIKNFPVPFDARSLSGFLGLTGYFRRFITGYSMKAACLYELTKKDVNFELTQEHRNAIEILRKELSSAPVLATFKFGAPTELHTDASSKGVGAVLLQQQSDGQLHPVFYYSSKLDAIQGKQHSFILEALALFKALTRFRVYLLGTKFTVVTDCNALRYTISKADVNPKIGRWILYFEEFEFEPKHRHGVKMPHVDSLSRFYVNAVFEAATIDPVILAQRGDSEIREIIEKVKRGDPSVKDFKYMCEKLYKIVDNHELFVVPRCMRGEIVTRTHTDLAHLGVEKTLESLKRTYYFPRMRRVVTKMLSQCLTCLEYNKKNLNNEGFLYPLDKGTQLWETLHIDHVGKLDRTRKGNLYIFEVVDAFSKFIYLHATKTTNAAEVLYFLTKIFSVHGAPKRIISDRGTAFTSESFNQFCNDWNVKHIAVAVRTPRANGQAERFNRVIIPCLCKITPSLDAWDLALPQVQLALNGSMHRILGKTPAEVFFGYRLRFGRLNAFEDILSEDLIQDKFEESREVMRRETTDLLRANQEKTKVSYDKKRRPAKTYLVDDLVLIKSAKVAIDGGAKLKPNYIGPYQVKKVLRNDRYIVGDIKGYKLKQKPYTGVLPSEQLKLWRLGDVVDVCDSDDQGDYLSDD